MKANDVLSRLRADKPELQRLATAIQFTGKAWSSRPDVQPVLEDLRSYGAGAALPSCSQLAKLFEHPDLASRFACGWTGAHLTGLGSEPLAQPAFGYQVSAGAAVVILARNEAAELSLVCFGNTKEPVSGDPETAYFAPSDRHEAVLAGSATAVLIRHDPRKTGSAAFTCARQLLAAGDILVQKGSLEAKALEQVDGRLVVLRLTRTLPGAGPAREYRLSDGALVHQSSTDKHESCQEMMMAVLGRMGRTDAVPAIAQLAEKGSDHLRWQATRQCLALDPASGFELLTEMARSTDDPLAAPAGALRAQLLEAYPALAAMEETPCLA